MNQAFNISQVNDHIDKIRQGTHQDSDIENLIKLSPAHYFDFCLDNKKLANPHHGLQALRQSIKMMDKKDFLMNYFLHRIASHAYDSLFTSLLKNSLEDKLYKDFVTKALSYHHIEKLLPSLIHLSAKIDKTHCMPLSTIQQWCHQVEKNTPPNQQAPYTSQFLDEYKKSAQLRDAILALTPEQRIEIPSHQQKRALTATFLSDFFNIPAGKDMLSLAHIDSFKHLSSDDIQSCFSLAFSLRRDYHEAEVKKIHAPHCNQTARSILSDAAQSLIKKLSSHVKIEKPKRILNAFEHAYNVGTPIKKNLPSTPLQMN